MHIYLGPGGVGKLSERVQNMGGGGQCAPPENKESIFILYIFILYIFIIKKVYLYSIVMVLI